MQMQKCDRFLEHFHQALSRHYSSQPALRPKTLVLHSPALPLFFPLVQSYRVLFFSSNFTQDQTKATTESSCLLYTSKKSYFPDPLTDLMEDLYGESSVKIIARKGEAFQKENLHNVLLKRTHRYTLH